MEGRRRQIEGVNVRGAHVSDDSGNRSSVIKTGNQNTSSTVGSSVVHSLIDSNDIGGIEVD